MDFAKLKRLLGGIFGLPQSRTMLHNMHELSQRKNRMAFQARTDILLPAQSLQHSALEGKNQSLSARWHRR